MDITSLILELEHTHSFEELKTLNDGVINKLQWMPPGHMNYKTYLRMKFWYLRGEKKGMEVADIGFGVPKHLRIKGELFEIEGRDKEVYYKGYYPDLSYP